MRETDVPIATSVCLWSNPGACFIYGTGLLKGRKNSNDKNQQNHLHRNFCGYRNRTDVLIHLTQTQTGGSGEVADFLMLSTLVVIAVLLYRGHKSRKMAVLGCAAGSVAMACVGMLTNYFLIIPFYSQVMPLQAIFDACNAINPYVTGMQGYLLLGVLPFNLIKGAILTAITMLAYKKLSVFIKSKQIELHHSRQRVG